MTAMTQQIRGNFDSALRAHVRDWMRSQFASPARYAQAAKIDKRTARARFDDIDPRDPSLCELERVVKGGRWGSFLNDVLRPVFETPEHELERVIREAQDELDRRRAAAAATAVAPPQAMD